MSELEMLGIGLMLGATVAVFAWLGWWAIKTEFQRYTDEQVREAKRELREYAREQGGSGR